MRSVTGHIGIILLSVFAGLCIGYNVAHWLMINVWIPIGLPINYDPRATNNLDSPTGIPWVIAAIVAILCAIVATLFSRLVEVWVTRHDRHQKTHH